MTDPTTPSSWIPAGASTNHSVSAQPLPDWRSFAPTDARFRYCPHCTCPLSDRVDKVNGRSRSTCPACRWVYYPTTLSGALVIEHADGVVVIDPPGSGGAALPGGIAEYAETPEECAIREAAEETGLRIEVSDELCRHLRRTGPFGPMLQFGFTARVVGGQLRDGDEGPARILPRPVALADFSPHREGSRLIGSAYLERLARNERGWDETGLS